MIGLLTQVRTKLVQLERRGDPAGIRRAQNLLWAVEKFTANPPDNKTEYEKKATYLAKKVGDLLKL